MIIGIVSDTHLGYGRFYEDSFRQAKEAFDRACAESDLVIVPGDIFDTKVPKLEVIHRSMEIFDTGRKKSWPVKSADGVLPVVAIYGTHERRAKGATNPVHLLFSSGYFTDCDGKCFVFEKDGEKVAIQGFGGVPDEHVKEEIVKTNFVPVEGAYNIFVFHQTLTELIPMAKGMTMDDLPPGFDLYVCGHIHSAIFERIKGKLLLIPGSTVITQLKKNETKPKGYVLFDTKTKSQKFMEIASRPYFFRELRFKDAENASVKSACRMEIDAILAGNTFPESIQPIIKVEVTGDVKEGLRKENFDFRDLIEEYRNRAVVEIDNALDSKDLQAKIELFKRMYEERKSSREIGLELLKAKAPGVPVEQFFEELSDSKNIDRFVEETK